MNDAWLLKPCVLCIPSKTYSPCRTYIRPGKGNREQRNKSNQKGMHLYSSFSIHFLFLPHIFSETVYLSRTLITWSKCISQWWLSPPESEWFSFISYLYSVASTVSISMHLLRYVEIILLFAFTWRCYL